MSFSYTYYMSDKVLQIIHNLAMFNLIIQAFIFKIGNLICAPTEDDKALDWARKKYDKSNKYMKYVPNTPMPLKTGKVYKQKYIFSLHHHINVEQ